MYTKKSGFYFLQNFIFIKTGCSPIDSWHLWIWWGAAYLCVVKNRIMRFQLVITCRNDASWTLNYLLLRSRQNRHLRSVKMAKWMPLLKTFINIGSKQISAVSQRRTCKWPHHFLIAYDAQCSESNGNVNQKIFRFLFFELSSKIGVIFSEKWH